MIQPATPSARELLGNGYETYLTDVILTEIQTLVDEGKVEPQVVRNVRAAIDAKGIDVIAPRLRHLDVASKNTVRERGAILEATLPLTDKVVIKHIIKVFSPREDFRYAVDIQRRVYEELKDSDLEGMVPNPTFARDGIMDTPCIDGATLKDRIMGEPIDRIEAELKATIDDYVRFYGKINDPEAKQRLKFRPRKETLGEYFYSTYLGHSDDTKERTREQVGKRHEAKLELLGLFREEIAAELDEASKNNAHGDLHPKNVIKNGRIGLLDFATATSESFAEQDIGKLLTKSRISIDLEEKLAQYTAEQLEEDEEEQRNSLRKFNKNQIAEDLFTAKRYLVRASKEKTPEMQTRLHNMALVSYNSALKRIEKGIEEGLVSERLLQAVKDYTPEVKGLGLHEVEDYERLREEFDPHIRASQENLLPPQEPLDKLVAEDAQKDLGIIRGKVRSSQRRRTAGRVGAWAAGIATVGVALGGMGYVILQEPVVIVDREQYEEMETDKRQLHENNSYRGIFQRSFRDLKDALITGKVKNKLFRNSPIVEQMAKHYGLDPLLVMRIMQSNQVFAGEKGNNVYEDLGVNIFDVLAFDAGKPSYHHASDYPLNQEFDPIVNLEFGLKRLADLRDQNDGDIVEALYQFWKPSLQQHYGCHGNKLESEEDCEDVKDNLDRLIASALYGPYSEWKRSGGASDFMYSLQFLGLSDSHGFYGFYQCDNPCNPFATNLDPNCPEPGEEEIDAMFEEREVYAKARKKCEKAFNKKRCIQTAIVGEVCVDVGGFQGTTKCEPKCDYGTWDRLHHICEQMQRDAREQDPYYEAKLRRGQITPTTGSDGPPYIK